MSQPQAGTIKKCTCVHEYQDKKFGPGMRAMNRAKPKDKTPTYRCTVCKALH